MKRQLLFILLFISIAACTPLNTAAKAPATHEITPTDCGCSSIYGPGVTPSAPASSIDLTPVGPEPSATPADLSGYQDRWSVYQNEPFGFSFEYPSVYEDGPFGFCEAREQNDAQMLDGALFALNLGSRTALTLSPSAGQTLAGAVEAFQGQPRFQGVTFDTTQERTVSGQPAVTLPYRSGGANRYAEATLWILDNVLYVVETGTPSACDVPDIQLTEWNAYQHLLESFTVTP